VSRDVVGRAPGIEQGPSAETPLFKKLKPGPGLSPDQVVADQRRRLHGAMLALIDQVGVRGVRVRSLARLAGVSTSTFYKHFADSDDCLGSTYEAVISTAIREAGSAQGGQSDWRRSLEAAVLALLTELAREPRGARLTLFHIFAGGPTARERIGRAVGQLETMLAAIFRGAPRSAPAPRHLVAAMAAGTLHVARATTLTGRSDELPGLAPEVTDWMLSLADLSVLSIRPERVEEAGGRRRGEPPGPSGGSERKPPPLVDDRERLLRAVLRLAEAEGFAGITPAGLRREAGVSRRRFEECFESLDECFLEAVGRASRDAIGRATDAAGVGRRWEQWTCRFIAALCAEAATDRARARLVFLGIFATGTKGLLTRERTIETAARALRLTASPGGGPSAVAAEASIAACWHLAASDIASGRVAELPSIAPLISYVLLAPALGPRVAATEITAGGASVCPG
jgi:AcrR family transcriptional regulator